LTVDTEIVKASVYISELPAGSDDLQLSITRSADNAEIDSINAVVSGTGGTNKYTILPTSNCFPKPLETKTCVLLLGGLTGVTRVAIYPSKGNKVGIDNNYEITQDDIDEGAPPNGWTTNTVPPDEDGTPPTCTPTADPTEICDGIDNDCINGIDEGCICWEIPLATCNDYDGMKDIIGTQCLDAGCSAYEQWCGGTDVNRDGVVSADDRNLVGNAFGTQDCNLLQNIYLDCYSTETCSGAVREDCLSVPGCSWA